MGRHENVAPGPSWTVVILAQPSPLLHTVTASGFCTAPGWVIGHISPSPHNGRLLIRPSGGLCYDKHHIWVVTVAVTIPDKLPCVLRGDFGVLIDQKDQVSLVLLHCFFHDDYEVITHITHEFDEQLYKRLPNLYAVWIADNNPSEDKRLVAGFLFKTSSTHSDPEFKDVLHRIVVSQPNLRARLNHCSTFLPTRLEVRGEAPLSEQEMRVNTVGAIYCLP